MLDNCVLYTFGITNILYVSIIFLLYKQLSNQNVVKFLTNVFINNILPLIIKNRTPVNPHINIVRNKNNYKITFIENDKEYQIYIPYDRYRLLHGSTKQITIVHKNGKRETIDHPLGVPFLTSAEHHGAEALEIKDIHSDEVEIYKESEIPKI